MTAERQTVTIRGEEVAVVRKGGICVVVRDRQQQQRRRPVDLAWYWPNYRRPAAVLMSGPTKPCTPCAAKAARLAIVST